MNNDEKLASYFYELSFEKNQLKSELNDRVIPEVLKEVIENVSYNSFEDFYDRYTEVRELPSNVIKDIKTSYFYITLDGFWIFLAETKLDNEVLDPRNGKSIDEVIEHWKLHIYPFYEEKAKELPYAIRRLIEANGKLFIKSKLKEHESLTLLSKEIINKMVIDFMAIPMWIYYSSKYFFSLVTIKSN